MMLNKNTIVAALACGALTMASLAVADEGEIIFQGEVKEVSCNIDINGSGSDATIILEPVYTIEFQQAGDTAGEVNFNVSFTDCSPNIELQGAAMTLHGPGVNSETGYLMNTAVDGAQNIEIQLLDGENPMDLRTDTQTEWAAFDAGSASLELRARYIATDSQAAITVGAVESSVLYTIVYE